ncbi:MAG: YHS domain-containing protein [Thermoplasmata archaeon]
MAKDPVCGMNVSENSKLFSEYNGAKYYFCSQSCKKSFDSHPGKYVAKK